MRIIDHDQRFVLGRHVDELREWRNLAVHTEDPIGNHQPPPDSQRACERCCQVIRITVAIPDHLGSRQSTAIDDAGMVEFI
jgi:hypothetical protein